MTEHFFQTFDENSDPSHGATRLALLREEMERRGLEGFCVPRADDIPGDLITAGVVQPHWGLHLVDVNLAIGNLVDIVAAEAKAYTLEKRR